MKMVLVIYDAGIDEDLRGVLDEARIEAYTKLTGATGTGHKGHRFGTPIWPGTNTLLWIALPDAQVTGLVRQLETLKSSYLKPPALHIFVLPVDVIGQGADY